MAKASVILIGYSGHAYVVIDCLLSGGYKVLGYCEKEEKPINPYNLKFLGSEKQEVALSQLKKKDYFIAIGNNILRQRLHNFLNAKLTKAPISAIHRSSAISPSVKIRGGVLIAPQAIVNSQATIGEGAICNTASVVEHECVIGKFSHIAPGAVLCGNVTIGEGSFVGANSVVKEGIIVGNNVTIGAGTVVIADVPDNSVIAGNPQRDLKK